MEGSLACTSVLRLGGSAGSEPLIDFLLDALATHFKNDDRSPPNTSVDTTQDLDDEDGALPLTMANKYFTASISLQRLGSIETASRQEEDSTTAATMITPIHNQMKEDGILLVFPSDSTISVDSSLTHIHESAEKNDQCGDLLRLCISVCKEDGEKGRKGKAYEEQYSRNVLWCLDRGYEYVEADLNEEARARGHDDREKDGFARICEAMNGTVWSSAIRRKVQQQINKRSSGEGQALSDMTSKGQTEEIKKDTANNMPQTPSNHETPDNTTSEDATHNEEKNEGIDDSLMLNDNAIDDAGNGGDTRDELIDSFQQAMKEAGRIRDASKAGNLSDGLRKKRAGDAANMLMGLLEKIGFDDESECDAVDSSDDEVL